MRRLILLLLVSLCVGPTGCKLFNKTNSDSKTKDSSTPARKEKESDPLFNPSSSNNPNKDSSSMLTGRVLDHSSNPPRDTFIRYRCVDDPKSPIKEAITDDKGFFQIWDVQPGKKYLLEARAKSDEKIISGIAYVSAPKMNVEINMKEDFSGAHTPAVSGLDSFLAGADKNRADPPAVSVGAPTMPERERQPLAIGSTASTPPSRPGTWIGKDATAYAGQDALLNVAINVPIPEASTTPPPVPKPPNPGFVEGDKKLPPTLDISPPPRDLTPVPPPNFPTPPPPVPALPTKTSGADFGPASVPSAIVVGRQVVNFALRDLNESAWELKRNRQGKLILLDFWRTDCQPCLASIPQLNALQNKYPLQTLEVIGIANERGVTMDDKRIQVMKVAKAKNISYRQLLDQNEFAREMRVQAVPTLVLLDERGYILWEHVGGLDSATALVLDRTIQNHLNRPQ